MTIVLNTDQQETPLDGGDYVISVILNGGTATLDLQHNDSSNWVDVGTLSETPEVFTLPYKCKLRLTKTGSSLVEISR